MRVKVTLGIVFSGVMLLGLLWTVKRGLDQGADPAGQAAPPATPAPSATAAAIQASTPSVPSLLGQPAPRRSLSGVSPGPTPAAAGLDASAAAADPALDAEVQAHIERLHDLSMRNDPESLQTILGDLTHEDRQIRAAAVEATVQFGSRAAIPKLREIAATTTDSGEKKALLEAADYLALPSLTEWRARLKQQKQAAGQTPGSAPSPEP